MFEKSVHKIIFTGPVGAGKTTAIGAISDIPPISTEQIATDETRGKKEKTTVAMDYGMMRLDGGEVIHIYGTPGQARFSFMWDILTVNAIGIIILLDNTNAEPLLDLEQFLRAFDRYLKNQAIAIGVTRMDLGGTYRLDDYHEVAKKYGFNAALFEVDARRPSDVTMLVQALLYTLDPGLA